MLDILQYGLCVLIDVCLALAIWGGVLLLIAAVQRWLRRKGRKL